jgi:phosphatidylethanolamine/phosphatidyl-N-methylethanolamine N-methyltransferase
VKATDFGGKVDEWLKLTPEEFKQKWYLEHYSIESYRGKGAFAQNLMHQNLERRVRKKHYRNVLEVGANRGEHLSYVAHSWDNYILTDIRIPESLSLSNLDGVHYQLADVNRLPFKPGVFDKVTSTCLLHHVVDPENVYSEIRRVMKPGGLANIFLPSDPGLIFRFLKAIGPVRSAKKKKIDHLKKLMDARDHINHVASLKTLAEHVFRDDYLRFYSYPIPGLSWNFSFWTVLKVIKG